MWTNENRARYDRSRLRYPSDLTDAEWAHVEPVILPAKRGGNRRHVDVREVVNGLMYILSTGCQGRAIPRWVASRSNFLVHVNVLARLFSGKMLAMLTDAHDAGQLKFFNAHAGLADKKTFKRFIAPLRRVKCRVGGMSPSPPLTDPDVQVSRIRFFTGEFRSLRRIRGGS